MNNEEKLLLLAKNGDVPAFEELICTYTTPLFNYIYKMLKNKEDAEDALQNTYIKAFKSISSFNGHSSFKTWLYKIATNVCFDEIRKNNRKKHISLNQEMDDDEFEIVLPDESYSPEKKAIKNSLEEVLYNALNNLSEEHRSVVILRDIDGFSYEEIAQTLSLSTGTVKSRINRARSHLKKLLEKDKELFL